MLREVTLEDISDGKTYDINDMAKCDTNGCKDCHKCCTGMGKSIILDPIDVKQIGEKTNKDFNSLLKEGYIELNVVDGLILPNIRMNENDSCSFLDSEGRCSIHEARPGICRLFPLGRIYEENDYKYFVQKGECICKTMTKVKIKKWLSQENVNEKRKFICRWHSFIRKTGAEMIRLRDCGRGEKLNDIAMHVLNEFFVANDIASKDIELYMNKIESVEKSIDGFVN